MSEKNITTLDSESKSCDHDYDYVDNVIICKSCSLRIELTSDLIKKIRASDAKYNEQSYKLDLEAISRQEEVILNNLKHIQNQLLSTHKIPEQFADLQFELQEKTKLLCKLQDDLEDARMENRKIESEVKEYRRRGDVKADIDVSIIIQSFIQFTTDMINQIQDIDSGLRYDELRDSLLRLQNNSASILKQLEFSLKNKGVVINHHERMADPRGNWSVKAIEEGTGKKEFDGKIKKSKCFGCSSKTACFVEIPEEVVVYKYNPRMDETIPTVKVLFNSNTDTNIKKEVELKSGELLDLIPMDFDKKPYHYFIGWCEYGSDQILESPLAISHDMELYASWNPIHYDVTINLKDPLGSVLNTVHAKLPIGRCEIELPPINDFDVISPFVCDITGEIVDKTNSIVFDVVCCKKIGSIQLDSKNLMLYDEKGIELPSYYEVTDNYTKSIASNDGSVKILSKTKIVEYNQRFPQKIVCEAIVDEEKKTFIVSIATDSNRSIRTGGTVADNEISHFMFVNSSSFRDYKLLNPVLTVDGSNIICKYSMEIKTVSVMWRVDNNIYYQKQVPVGTVPDTPKEPVKKTNGETVFIFSYWDPPIKAVYQNTIYNARFKAGNIYEMILALFEQGLNKETIRKKIGINKDFFDKTLEKLESDGRIIIKNKKVMIPKKCSEETKDTKIQDQNIQ